MSFLIPPFLLSLTLAAPPTELHPEPNPLVEPGTSTGIHAHSGQGGESRFLVAEESLRLEVDGDGLSMSYEQLVDRYAKLTGAAFTYDPETEQVLRSRRIRLIEQIDIPPRDVPRVVETLLFEAGLVLILHPSPDMPIVRVVGVESDGIKRLRSRALQIEESELEFAKSHPATVVMLSVGLPNLDARAIGNAMRTLIVDTNISQIIPAGVSHGVVLVGTGSQVAAHADVLRGIDAAANSTGTAARAKVTVVELKHGRAESIAGLVRVLFEQRSVDTASDSTITYPSALVQVDRRTNTIVIRAREAELAEILMVIGELDRPVD